jgi:2-amino-4-hydroxy-6-hydroxymethyldihydropteridine diphosphokinase
LKSHKVFLGLGSNLGNRKENLRMARMCIAQIVGLITKESSIYETTAWGIIEQNAFLNQVIAIETIYSPSAVLHLILKIEKDIGRVREIKWGERIIDIDILYYDNEIVSTETLNIPHLFIQERNFVLVPLTEIAGNFLHPKLLKTNQDLLNESIDSGEVKPIPIH